MSNFDLMQLALRLRAIARDDGSLDAAQVKLIGLDDIRAAAGENWPRMRERVRAGSLDILTRHARSEDVIVPAGDGFLVVLAEGPPGANQDRCKKMRDALLAFYLGEEALQSLRPEVTARSLSADGFADLIATGMRGPSEPSSPAQPAARQDIAQARVFSTREGRVVARWLCPVRAQAGQQRLAYDCEFVLDGSHRGQSFIELDLAILSEAEALVRANPSDALATGFTVHASTLQLRRTREAYLAALAQSDTALRRRAIITVAEIEKGTPLLSISEWCSNLRTAVSRVCVDFHHTDHAIASIGATGAWAGGFHLPIHSGAQKGPRAMRTLDQLQFWSRAMHSQGMRLAVNGFREADFVQQATKAGVDIATSDTLWPFTTSQNNAAA